jgi:hypothetical protein
VVAQVQEEAPEFVGKCIRTLDASIAEIPAKQRKTLSRALFLKPTLETDTKFKLMFLHADYYDNQKAAQRMINYFDKKWMLFGEAKLVKRITMDDLSDEGMQVFKAGCTLVLPIKDQAGRPVFFFDYSKVDLKRMSANNLV